MLYPGSSHSPAVASRSRAGCTGQVHKTAKARDEPTCDKKLYSRIGRLLRVERHSVVEGVKAVRWRAKDAMERVGPLVLSDSAGIGYSPQEFSRLAMGCSYNSMKMSVVFVSGAQTWHKIKTGAAGGAIFHSPHRGQRTSGAYASCCWPAALVCSISHRTCCMV